MATLRIATQTALESVGSALLGQWEEWTGNAFHLRRRLRPEEAEITGPIIDIRGTSEARKRLKSVAKYIPQNWTE